MRVDSSERTSVSALSWLFIVEIVSSTSLNLSVVSRPDGLSSWGIGDTSVPLDSAKSEIALMFFSKAVACNLIRLD